MEAFTQTGFLMGKIFLEAQTQTEIPEFQSCSNCETDFFCPICQDTEKCILVLPTCRHKLHSHCAPPWFGEQKKDTCPVCRELQPPSFLQSFQTPATLIAEQRRRENLRQRLQTILDTFYADMGQTPSELERNVRLTLQRLDGLSRFIGTDQERTMILQFRNNLQTMVPTVPEDRSSSDDSSSSEEEWMPVRPILTNEERTVRTRSIIDERTRHVIGNLNIALSNDRNQYGIERALTHSLHQLSRLERMEMDQRNRRELEELRRNLMERLPQNRPNELLVQDTPQQAVERRARRRRTLRQMARNPYIPRETPDHRLFTNESDTIQIVDVRSIRN